MTPETVLPGTAQTIDSVRDQIANGSKTAQSLAEAAYARIAETDPSIHAFLALSRERALKQAQKIDGYGSQG